MTALLDHATEVVVIAVEDLYDEVPPGFHDSLCGSVYDALALALARAQPEGWVLVPREPTEAMVHEGGLMCDDGTEHEERARARGVWIMMVEASPLCPAAPTSDGGEG